MSNSRILEGVFAIEKPGSKTSADIIRDLQRHFNPSSTFKPWVDHEYSKRAQDGNARKRKKKRIDVKMGHGGTLDPLATGVLVIGVGKGTKSLPSFLGCTKGYEATVLFGAATDTYDITGKLLGRAGNGHVTREAVEAALGKFRGEIMQKPPIYSALRMDGKRLYEYAREGKELPKEIAERPVTVEELEMVRWLEPGSHEFKLPREQADPEMKVVADKVLHIEPVREDEGVVKKEADAGTEAKVGEKRKRESDEDDPLVIDRRAPAERQESDSEALMSGGIGPDEGKDKEEPLVKSVSPTADDPTGKESPIKEGPEDHSPPGVVLRMTVTSGFYVRTLCHDLGKALGSLGLMATLVRTRQGDFELGKNALPYEDLAKGEDVWGPKVTQLLEDWQRKPTPPKE